MKCHDVSESLVINYVALSHCFEYICMKAVERNTDSHFIFQKFPNICLKMVQHFNRYITAYFLPFKRWTECRKLRISALQ